MRSFGYIFLSVLTGVVILLWGTGCGTSNSLTGAKMEWTTQVNYDHIETSHVEPDQGSVLVGKGKNFILLGGQQGSALRQEPESKGIGGMFKSMVKESISIEIEGIEITDLFSEADRFSFAFLDFADAMIILDYTSDSDIIRMVDMATGEELWKSEDYQWSLARYQNIAGEISKGLLKNVGLGAAAASGISGAEMTRERFAQNLVTPVPEQNAILFRTTDGLLMLDARTAETKWKMDDYEASGINNLIYLEESKDLLFVTYVSRLFDAMDTSRQIMRVDAADGTVKWSTKYQHASRYIHDLELVDNRILLRYKGSQAEVFDLNSGEVLVSPQSSAAAGVQRWLEIQSGDSSSIRPPAQIVDNSLYTIQTSSGGMGQPSDMIARYNVETGGKEWITEPFKDALYISNILSHGDLLIVSFVDSETPVKALNTSDGSVKWSISDLDVFAQLFLHKDRLYVTHNDILRLVNSETGETIKEISFEDSGLGGIENVGIFGEHLYIKGAKGVALYSVENLEEINIWLPKGQIEESQRKGDRLFVKTSPLFGLNSYLRVMDLNTGNQITEFKLDTGMLSWFGNLRNGIFIPDRGQSVYIRDEEKRITKYSIGLENAEN